MFSISTLIRGNIRTLQPYSSARDEYCGAAAVFLDANENSLGNPLGNEYNRYPDPHQVLLKEAISQQKKIAIESIFLGNGSDECIDILYRCFCNPGKDNVIICPPTYGMYEVSANINDIEVRKVRLLENFQLNLKAVNNQVDASTKMIWICSPNNPTGNSINRKDIKQLLSDFKGLIVIDETYIDFASRPSFISEINNYANLVILQTLSKAWGLAALRLGIAFASAEIIAVLNKVKPPYNISGATQQLALDALRRTIKLHEHIKEMVRLRAILQYKLVKIKAVEQVYLSDANFLLVRVKDANKVYAYLLSKGIVVRNRASIILCGECLRITVGTRQENEILVNALLDYSKQIK
jgi:histidinol-phosphate aminotransferase